MNFEYRKATEQERDKYLDFANMVFSMSSSALDFQGLIPKVYGAHRQMAHLQNIAVTENGEMRGLVAVYPGQMQVMDVTLKTGFVGTVSTHPHYRGEGHMIKLMNKAVGEMAENGTDIAMLGGQRQRYEYFGFTKSGISRAHTVGRSNVRHALKDVDTTGIEIREVAADDKETLENMRALFNERKLHFIRSEADFWDIIHTWFNRPLAITKDGEFAGYLILAYGDKLQNIKELVLTDYDLTEAVIKALVLQNDYGIEITTADHETELIRRLAKFEEYSVIKESVQAHIYNFARVLEAFLKLKASYSYVADAERSFDIDGQKVHISVKDGKVNVDENVGADRRKLTAMEAQYLFFTHDGVLNYGELPAGWDRLPLYIDNCDEF